VRVAPWERSNGLAWTQRVYYALPHEAAASGDEADADAMATLVVDTQRGDVLCPI
jgi:hypothetical protein